MKTVAFLLLQDAGLGIMSQIIQLWKILYLVHYQVIIPSTSLRINL
jgi:hypothetical protein